MNKKKKRYLQQVAGLHSAMEAEVAGEADTSEFEQRALDLQTFRREIPDRKFLFYHEEILGIKEGFLPRGVPCLIAAPGGCGKTYLLMQLAVAAATGGYWLNAKASKPIKVLFLAAEEEQDEIDRRAQAVARSMGVMDNPERLSLAETNLRLFGRVGRNERLMDDKQKPAEVFNKLKLFLDKNPDISLVILDPASDYMSREAEKDSAEAKDWTKLISQLTMTAGRPTVLVAHHTRKDSKTDHQIYKTCEKDQAPTFSVDDIRGSGSLVQSFRWVMALDRRDYDDGSGIVFSQVVKTNYTKRSGIFKFDIDKDHGGILKFNKMLPDEVILNNNKVSTSHKKQSLNDHIPINRDEFDSFASDIDDIAFEEY